MTGNEVWFDAAKYLYQNKIAKPIMWLGDDRHFKKAKEIHDAVVTEINHDKTHGLPDRLKMLEQNVQKKLAYWRHQQQQSNN